MDSAMPISHVNHEPIGKSITFHQMNLKWNHKIEVH